MEGREGGWIMMDIKKVGYAVMMLSVLAMPFFVFALNEPTPPIGGYAINLEEIKRIIEVVARFLIIVGVIIAVIFIIWGGITYMAAGGDEGKAGTAKTRIINGVIGAAIVLGVGLILQTIAGFVAGTFFG